MAQNRITIVQDSTTGDYSATIAVHPMHRKKVALAQWVADEPQGFPADSTLFIQFVERTSNGKVNVDGPLAFGSRTHGRHEFERKVLGGGRVRHHLDWLTAFDGGHFWYQIGYNDGADHILLDPELVVDGESTVLTKLLRLLLAQLLARSWRAPKKVKKTKAAKTAAKKTPATRKAKKR